MTAPGRVRRAVGAGAAGCAATAAVFGGGATEATAASRTPSVSGSSPLQVPLATSLPSVAGTWVTLPMGVLDDPQNTFWQAFLLPAGGRRWLLRTPPGVAANGGLALSATGTDTAIGFLTSAQLTFSPLAVTHGDGTTYAPGLLPAALADVPDALAVGPGGRLAALAASGVLVSGPTATDWQTLVSDRALRSSPAGRPCAIGAPTAVSAAAAATFVGVTCANPDTVGIVRMTGRPGPSLVVGLVGPHLPGLRPGAVVSVLRLVPFERGVATFLAVRQPAGNGSRSGTAYVAAWDPMTASGTAWSISPMMTSSGTLASVSVTSATGFALLTRDRSSLAAAVIQPGAAAWSALPTPPARTATLAVTGARVDALEGGLADFTDTTLRGGGWRRTQVIGVAVPLGPTGS